MMPLGDSVKGTLFVQDEDGEYKELGHVSSIEFSKELNEDDNDFNDFSNILQSEGTVECEISIKRYKKKRFKKLLMSYGIERNLAEICSKICPRNRIHLEILGGIQRNAR